jgi:hypothetical protein
LHEQLAFRLRDLGDCHSICPSGERIDAAGRYRRHSNYRRVKPNDEFVVEKIVETIDHLKMMLRAAMATSFGGSGTSTDVQERIALDPGVHRVARRAEEADTFPVIG